MNAIGKIILLLLQTIGLIVVILYLMFITGFVPKVDAQILCEEVTKLNSTNPYAINICEELRG